jgi:hypothetical protein
VTGTKAAFGRTPKVRGRTVVPAVYLVAVFAILTEWMFGIARDVVVGRPVHALLTAMNVGFLAYGIMVYIGVRNAAHDLTASIPISLRWQRVARATPGRTQPSEATGWGERRAYDRLRRRA